MSEEQKTKEAEVFDQELSMENLDAVAGGQTTSDDAEPCTNYANAPHRRMDTDTSNCVKYHQRQLYGGGGFPNCAATVEDGSWCKSSDACVNFAVDYKGMTNCKKAWR